MHWKRIILSDCHLGMPTSKVKELNHFMENNTCDELILNGDIIDGWSLKKYGKWKKKHTKFFKHVLDLMGKHGTKVVLLRGNHDDFLDEILPFSIAGFHIVNEYEFESHGKNYYVIHGDVFDQITSHQKWVAVLGSYCYDFLLWVNKIYNHWRLSRGKKYYSLSQKIKKSVKYAVNYVGDFEEQIVNLAQVKGYDGVICGHIHSPVIKKINNILYLNSGDYVETMSCIVEDFDGNFEIIYYEDSILNTV